MRDLLIQHVDYEAILVHTWRNAPQEGCGLIGGRWLGGSRARTQISTPILNISRQPEITFEMDQREMVAAILAFNRVGLEVVGIYHSHPISAPVPSQTDIREALWPDAIYLIVGFAASEHPEVPAWQIRDGHAERVEIRIEAG